MDIKEGDTIGFLTVLRKKESGKGVSWDCECKCGKILNIHNSLLKNGLKSL